MKKSILKLGNTLNKKTQQQINGGLSIIKSCFGTATLPPSNIAINGNGYSPACVGNEGKCTINGHAASCNNDGTFWYY
ncbi:hypothetical protein [Tenacibaculum amylolyticum]|uniref:hypothetical protein n=1 Tax=Tenacibaculum amylolyticum TaxID=104269 RepID=UPI0038B4E58E